jgi:pullulanase
MSRWSRAIPLLAAAAVMAGAAVLVMRLAAPAPPPAASTPQQVEVPAAEAEAPAAPGVEIPDTAVLAPDRRVTPGLRPSTTLRYRNPNAASVLLAGSWDGWSTNHALRLTGRDWCFDVRGLGLSPGCHAFKFLPDGEWEPGDNRALFINRDGLLERPADLTRGANHVAADRIHVRLAPLTQTEPPPRPRAALIPPAAVRGVRWLAPPSSDAPLLELVTAAPLPLTNSYTVVLEGLAARPAYAMVHPLPALDAVRSEAPLGADVDRTAGTTTFRLFAPRASSVELCLFESPAAGAVAAAPDVRAMRNESGGTWALTLPGALHGARYGYRVDGPQGPGEGFNAGAVIGDPYTRAVSHSRGPSRVVDSARRTEWFTGWTDQAYRAPAPEDMLIYETHVRDFSIHPSARVPAEVRGRYAGVAATAGQGTGLDHLKALGVNMIEFMPVQEFDNAVADYGWGYAPVYFFAPESSYARAPDACSQIDEFKQMVNALHGQGFGVLIDVVYNHIGALNVFYGIDLKYYFRMNADFTLENYSGCGNDVRTEAPMMRRLIIESLLFWMREFHVDGFRFDLAELIDFETLMAVRDRLRAENPNVVLISEPWSFRGDHKEALRGTGWSAWNNGFRDTAKWFCKGHENRDYLKKMLTGSTETWTAHPLQSVNYLESHDDRTLSDDLTENAAFDGRRITPRDAARNRLAATILFTSLGIPMLAEGQAFMRSKHGIHNTFDSGDALNAVRWTDRARPEAAATLAYYRALVRLRQSAAGVTFRIPAGQAVPENYYRWIEPANGHALGYVVNGDGQRPGRPFAVLLNAAEETVAFPLPPGKTPWRLIGDGRRIAMGGMSGGAVVPAGADGLHTVRVPPLSAFILAGGR